MNDLFDEPWITQSGEMAEEFFQNHRATMPEDPHNVQDQTELVYFMWAFVFWSAQTKFKLKYRKKFLIRAEQFRKNIESALNEPRDFWEDDIDLHQGDYATYLKREKLYVSILMKSTSSFFKTLTGSTMKEAVKALL